MHVLLERSTSSNSGQNLVSYDNHQKPVDCPQLASHHNPVPVWLHGLIDCQLKSKSNIGSKSTSSNAAGPDLELKLAGPRPNLEQNKSSTPGPLLVGPITVT